MYDTEAIKDLESIKSFFMEKNKGCYPACLDNAIKNTRLIEGLRKMTVDDCAGHSIEYAQGWKACIEWLRNGGDKE